MINLRIYVAGDYTHSPQVSGVNPDYITIFQAFLFQIAESIRTPRSSRPNYVLQDRKTERWNLSARLHFISVAFQCLRFKDTAKSLPALEFTPPTKQEAIRRLDGRFIGIN